MMGKFWLYLFFFGAVVLLSCEERKTNRADEFRQTVERNDSVELASARLAAEEAGRDVQRLQQMMDAYKKRFVFEKEEKYQTEGYWVLPAYKGSKERFAFFTEVEESGKLLLVSIDKQRRYSFSEVDLSNEDYTALLPQGLTKQQLNDVGECYVFAKTMKLLDEAQKRQEKMALKVRFFEEKKRKREK